jgi:hypothetical protein
MGRRAMQEWMKTEDLCTSLTISNVMQSNVGKVLEAIREAGFEIEINVTRSIDALAEHEVA